jgi:uncharacterized membrane protein
MAGREPTRRRACVSDNMDSDEVYPMRWAGRIIGVLAVIIGIVWLLQGLNILGGSGMSGQFIFVVIGAIVAVIGVILVAVSSRRRKA